MIYISGAVTDNPTYLTDFENAEDLLRIKGHEDIINPVKIMANLPENTPYKRYIDITLECLKDCDSIYMLNGWESSKGARLEHAYAECAGMKILYENDEGKTEEKKYYWKLNGFKDDGFDYLNLDCYNGVSIKSKEEATEYNTKFTESEYKELSKKFGFPEDMFAKEEIE